jgi:hypothetical protein
MFEQSFIMALKIITIVPRLPPLVDGVGDYAFQLAQALRTHHQIETQFIVCDPDWEDATAVAPFPVTVMAAASETALDGQCLDPLETPLWRSGAIGDDVS